MELATWDVPHYVGSEARSSNRTVGGYALWEEGKWSIYQEITIPSGERKKIILHPIDAVSIAYLAKDRQSVDDLHILFLETICQHMIHDSDGMALALNLESEIDHLASLLGILRVLEQAIVPDMQMQQLVSAQIKAIISCLRAIFDCTHKLVCEWWRRVQLTNQASQKRHKGQQLPDSFANMALEGEKLRDEHSLTTKYALAPLMAQAYVQSADFFRSIRRMRVRIEHSGGRNVASDVSRYDGRLACFKEHRPFSLWPEVWEQPGHTFDSDKVGDLWLWVDYIVLKTLQTQHALIAGCCKEIVGLPRAYPDYRIFLRWPVHSELNRILRNAGPVSMGILLGEVGAPQMLTVTSE
jgi:hypothetical protein